MDGNEPLTPFTPSKTLIRSPTGINTNVNRVLEGGGTGPAGNETPTEDMETSQFFTPSRDVTAIGLHQRLLPGAQGSAARKRKYSGPVEQSKDHKQIQAENTAIISTLQQYLYDCPDQQKRISKAAANIILTAARDLEVNCNALVTENAELKGEIRALKSQLESKSSFPDLDSFKNCTALMTENAELKGEITALKSQQQSRQEPATPFPDLDTLENMIKSAVQVEIKTLTEAPKYTPSYASAILNRPSATPRKPAVSVMIAQTEKSKESFPTIEDLKKGVKANFKPAAEGVKIRGLIETKKGVVIKTSTKDDAQKVLQSESLKKLGAQIKMEPKRLPRMIIYDVPSCFEPSEIIEYFWSIENPALDRKKHTFKPIFKTGPVGKEFVHWVVEVSPAVKEEMLAEGRVFLDWAPCNTREWLSVTRCNHCQGFGHAAKFCQARTAICAHCSERGHSNENCPSAATNAPPKCFNCSRTNQQCDHPATSKDCPSFKKALARLSAQTMCPDDE